MICGKNEDGLLLLFLFSLYCSLTVLPTEYESITDLCFMIYFLLSDIDWNIDDVKRMIVDTAPLW